MMNSGYEQHGSRLEEELLRVQLEIQERELEMISAEIFDNVGQVLSLAKLQLSTHVPLENEHLSRSMESSSVLVGKAIQDLRQLARPVTIAEIREKGLIYALGHEMEIQGRIYNRTIGFTVSEKIERIDTASELIAFRLLQQLLTIFVEVSGNRAIFASVERSPNNISFLISNNPLLHTVPPGVVLEILPGVRQMKVRAEMIRADLRISGMPDGELAILLILPLDNS